MDTRLKPGANESSGLKPNRLDKARMGVSISTHAMETTLKTATLADRRAPAKTG